MVNVGPLEIMLVAIIALVVLGPARLPEMARSVGRGMREFRGALNSAGDDDDRDDYEDDPVDEDEPPEPDKRDEAPAATVPAVEPPPLPKEPPGSPADLPEGR